jgi:hypothetical protein
MNANNPMPRLVLSNAVIKETERLLRGFRRLETTVSWFGVASPSAAVVVTVVRPRQYRTAGSFDVDAAANADVAIAVCEHDLTLIAQVHSHPGKSVSHSYGDDEGAPFTYNGFLSIVVPNYCRDGMLPLEKCGIHLYRGSFRRLTREQVAASIRVVPNVIDLL